MAKRRLNVNAALPEKKNTSPPAVPPAKIRPAGENSVPKEPPTVPDHSWSSKHTYAGCHFPGTKAQIP
jgi:hypothetical protein